VTGVVANVMLAASGFDIGKANKDFIESQGYLEQIDRAKKILDDFDGKVGLPIDVALNDNGSRIEVSVEEVGDSVLPINDIGIETIVAYSREISQAGTVILNGPAGVSEQDGFELGTYEIVKAATEADYSIAGGGHISAEVRNMGFDHSLSHISTGGGSCIDYLAGTPLPAIEALKKAAVIISKHD
jgi:phosphoglycerate kinase